MSSSQSEVEILSKLADQYRDKGKVNPWKNWTDILKAHTLYNACAFRSSHGEKWRERAFALQQIYWGDVVSSTPKQQVEIARDFQTQLYRIREECKDDLAPVTSLINRWDCTTENLDSANNKESTRQLVKEMKTVSLTGNAKMKVFAGKVIQKSVEITHKKVPCKFAAVALGSMAKGEATPYSDLEFMFLLEKKTTGIVKYFETLAMTVYFLIGNLQETKLKYMNIEELKLFRDEGTNGFKIDGLQSKAGNIPTGNGTAEQKNRFILTVDELLDKYQHVFLNPDPEESKKGDFTSMLAHTTVICGEPSLLTNFKHKKKMVALNVARISAHNRMVKQDVDDYDFLPQWELEKNNYSANLKSAIYRFPSILTYNLKIVYKIESKTSWDTLDKLHQMKKLSQSFYVSLQFLLASALYIRMAAYLHHDSQNDDMSFLPSSDPSSQGRFWHIPKPLFLHMTLHMTPVKQTIEGSTDPLHAVTAKIVSNTNVVSAYVNYHTGNHEEALKIFESLPMLSYNESAMLANCYLRNQQWNNFQMATHNLISIVLSMPDDPSLFARLLHLKYRSAEGYALAGDLVSAKRGFDELLDVLPSDLNLENSHHLYANASNFYLMISDEVKSKHYYEKACAHLEKVAPTINQSEYDASLSSILYDRAATLFEMLRHREAEPLANQSIYLLKKIYGENGICPNMAHAYLLLGGLYGELGQHPKSLDYIRKAEKLYALMNPATKESNLSVRYDFMAVVYTREGKLDMALEYYLKALHQIEKEGTLNHVRGAKFKIRIGTVLMDQGKYEEAATYMEDSIEIYDTLNNGLYDNELAKCHLFYGRLCFLQDRQADSLNHLYKATSFRYQSDDIDHMDTMSQAWSVIGRILIKQSRNYEEATSCFEKATSFHHQQSRISTDRYAMMYLHLGQCYLQSPITKEARAQMVANSKAHQAFVRALSLLVNSTSTEDFSPYILGVAAQMFLNWDEWLSIYNESKFLPKKCT